MLKNSSLAAKFGQGPKLRYESWVNSTALGDG
jgi:hypothetical protein